MRCDDCGRFTRHTNDVWDSAARQIDREVCDDCHRIARRDEETMTDTDALIERIARAIHLDDLSAGEAEPWGVDAYLMAWYRRNAAAVLPIVAVEVRKAKAEALRDAVEKHAITIPDALGYKVAAVTVEDLLDTADGHEAGGSDEHR